MVRRRGKARVAAVVVGLGVASGLLAPARAADPLPTTLSLIGAPAYADATSTLQMSLVGDDAIPVAGATVSVLRRVSGTWRPIGTTTTDADGTAALAVLLRRVAGDNVFRARFAGSATHAPSASSAVTVPLLRRRGVVTLTGPASVVDEKSVRLRARWRTSSGAPVAGTVRLLRRDADGDWRRVRRLRTGADGFVEVVLAPRSDSRWRVEAPSLDWVTGDRSPVLAIDNLPPGRPVTLPARAPDPRITLPPQRRAVGEGPNVTIGRIPNAVWREMTGRSWHPGCPVGRGGLRLVRVNYWGYDGYRRRGEVVAAAGAARQMAGALAAMYRGRFPIRAMYRVDRFGWSRRLGGANDYRSMAAGNTSAFNCRSVVNRPGVRSPHSWGRSLDVNTWENPYRSATGLVPNAWWQSRSHPLVAWRSHSHAVVRLMARHGLRWTYGRGDTQHFDATYRNGRTASYPGCAHVVCK